MHPLRSGDVLGGDYRIERALGSGGMGTLYVATQLSTGKKRALKLLRPELLADPSLRERFEREARVGASIESDHVVDVIAAGIDEASGAPWLAMELLDGEDLATFLSRRGPLPPELACDIVAQLTHAMGAAHAAGVVHRDLKPENVFIASARREGAPLLVKVLDFGIAKVLRSGGPTGTAAIGTLAWMAPEQTDERGEIGPPTDIWALGLIVFNVLTGARYWPDASMSILARKLLVDPLLSASERAAELGRSGMLPGGFDGWFGRCVARDPKDRFGSASDARVALERVLRHTGAEPTIAHAPPTISRAPARRAEQRWRIPGEGSPRRGPESALVTVVQFADFECPYSMAAEGIVREILDTHGDDVAIVWKDVPYDAHPAAHGAARFARLARRALGDERGFWAAHDRLYESCPTRGLADLEHIGADLGLERDAVRAAIEGPDDPDTIRDVDLAIDFHASLIPHFFVNGRRLVGYRSMGQLRLLVEDELARARALVASGVPRARVQDEIMRDASGPPPPERPRTFLPEQHRTPRILGAHAAIDTHLFSNRASPFDFVVQRTVRRFLDEHGDEVRFHFHDLVDFDDAVSVDVGMAARAALDVGGDAGYWRLHAILVASSPQHPEPSTPSRGFARPALFQYAAEAGLPPAYFRVSFDNPERRRELERTRAAALEAGARPGEFLVLVGRHHAGGLTLRQMERALGRARADLGGAGAPAPAAVP